MPVRFQRSKARGELLCVKKFPPKPPSRNSIFRWHLCFLAQEAEMPTPYRSFWKGVRRETFLQESSPRLPCLKGHSYDSGRSAAPRVGCTYGEAWRGDESPLHIIAQRCALGPYLRGRATERSSKSRTFTISCRFLTTVVAIKLGGRRRMFFRLSGPTRRLYTA